jgi:hypothetical protein
VQEANPSADVSKVFQMTQRVQGEPRGGAPEQDLGREEQRAHQARSSRDRSTEGTAGGVFQWAAARGST